jgi:hypothetical protein
MTDTPTAYPIPVTSEELASVCDALRHMAHDMDVRWVFNRRNRVRAALTLAYDLEARHRAAVVDAGRVERIGEEE